jgi:hypothetical protein
MFLEKVINKEEEEEEEEGEILISVCM